MRESQVVAEWRAEARREDLLRALELRFGGPIPDDLVEEVEALADSKELSRWFDLSQTTSSLTEFRMAIRHG